MGEEWKVETAPREAKLEGYGQVTRPKWPSGPHATRWAFLWRGKKKRVKTWMEGVSGGGTGVCVPAKTGKKRNPPISTKTRKKEESEKVWKWTLENN